MRMRHRRASQIFFLLKETKCLLKNPTSWWLLSCFLQWSPNAVLHKKLNLWSFLKKVWHHQRWCPNLRFHSTQNPDSIEHTFLYCQVSKEFFSKTLRWFNEYHKENIQLSNKQILFNTFDDSLPMQMPISTQSKLRLLVLLQKKYLYTCKNIVTKPNLEEFLRKLFEQYRIENCGKQY